MKVLVIHRSPVVAQGLCLVLKAATINPLSAGWDGYQALTAVLESFEPDVVLADPQIAGMDMGRTIATVAVWNKNTPVAIISIDQTPALLENAIAAGANGYLSLSVTDEEFVSSLRLLAAGQVVATGPAVSTLADVAKTGAPSQVGQQLLTHREAQIAELVARGLTNSDVANKLDLSEGTVKVHIRNIFRKLGMSNRAELTGFALRTGLAT